MLPSTNEGVDIGTDYAVVRPCRLCFYLTHVANIAKVVISETLECGLKLLKLALKNTTLPKAVPNIQTNPTAPIEKKTIGPHVQTASLFADAMPVERRERFSAPEG